MAVALGGLIEKQEPHKLSKEPPQRAALSMGCYLAHVSATWECSEAPGSHSWSSTVRLAGGSSLGSLRWFSCPLSCFYIRLQCHVAKERCAPDRPELFCSWRLWPITPSTPNAIGSPEGYLQPRTTRGFVLFPVVACRVPPPARCMVSLRRGRSAQPRCQLRRRRGWSRQRLAPGYGCGITG